MYMQAKEMETLSGLYIPFIIPPMSQAVIYAAFNGIIKKRVQIRPADSKNVLRDYSSCNGARQSPAFITNDGGEEREYMILVTLENITCDKTPPLSFSSLREIGTPEGATANGEAFSYRSHFFSTLDERDTVFITIIVQVGVDI